MNENEKEKPTEIEIENENEKKIEIEIKTESKEEEAIVSGGVCVACRKPATKKCDRCKDFYCSDACQKEDFPKHRYICFQMPELVRYVNPSEDHCAICVVCRKIANLCCSKCGDVYCTLDCQMFDWNSHRYICFPMPNLVPLQAEDLFPQLTFDIDINPLDEVDREKVRKAQCYVPPHETPIQIMGFRSSNSIYLRSNTTEAESHYNEILKRINDFVKQAKLRLYEVPQKKGFGLAKFDSFWYRVRVLDWDEDENYAKVLAVDIGEIRICKLTYLYRLPIRFNNLRQYVVNAVLKDVPDFDFIKYPFLRDTLRNYLKEYKIRYCIDNKESIEGLSSIVLYKEGDSKTLNEQLVDICHSKVHMMESAKNLAVIPDGEFTVVNINDLREGYFACVRTEHYEWFMEIQKKLSKFRGYGPSYKPKKREFCLAKFDGKWYRAQCFEKNDNFYKIFYIDFGNEKHLYDKDIREYPSDFTTETKTILCYLEGLPRKLTEQQIEFLEEFFLYNPKLYLASIRAVLPPLYSAKCDKVITEMQKVGLVSIKRNKIV